MTTHPTRRSRALALLLAALLGAAPLAACGGGDDGGAAEVASLGESDEAADDGDDGGGGGGGSGDEVTDAEREDALLEFAACMREHGVDMPDPDVTGDGFGIAISSEMGTPEEIEAAQEACQPIMEDVMGERPQMDPEEEAEMRDSMLAYAQCMREHGVDMPDPEFEEGGRVRMRVGSPGGGGLDPESEEFVAAEEICRDEAGFADGEGPMSGRAARPSSGGGG